MKSVVIIPARFGSSRFPGKPLADICGIPMICHVYRRAEKASKINEVIVATDDVRIMDAVTSFGGKAIMTPSNIKSGTDRVRSVASGKNWDVVINLQGDEPLIEPSIVDRLSVMFQEDEELQIATAAVKSTAYEDYVSPHVVKVVFDKNGKALYFSRAPIPYSHEGVFQYFFKHIGVYAFRKNVLEEMGDLKDSAIEKTESLEQLKWMDYGYDIRVIEVNYEPVGVDTPDDLEIVRNIILQEEGSGET